MLGFFRKYQKFFFLFTALIIITSFAFFGTYQAIVPTKKIGEDQIVFKTLDGKKISGFYHHAMTYFLAPPASSGLANIFNDGVIEKDFLQSGLAPLLVEKFKEPLAQELLQKRERELRFSPYVHPLESSLSAERAWKEFAPDIYKNFVALKEVKEGDLKTLFTTKANLYLAEQQFPPQLLQRVLGFQLQQLKNIPPDQKLLKGDLHLFGYKEIRDWFGTKFVDGVATVIFQGAAYARQQGYKISRQEVLSDLLCKSEEAYQALKGRLEGQVANSTQLYHRALQAMQLDEATLISLWEDILLFRRLLDDVGGSALADTFALDKFYSYANESVDVTLFHLPSQFQLKSFEDLQKFELYLEASTPYTLNDFTLPTVELTVEEVMKKEPSLVVRNYELEIASLTSSDLSATISVKKTWEWEVEEGNFKKLKEKFPILGLQKGTGATPEERFAQLQSLPHSVRQSVDHYARELILAEHPEWMGETLEKMEKEKKTFSLSLGSPKIPLKGISDGTAFLSLLENPSEKLKCYSQDGVHYYFITVKKISPPEKLMFAKAQSLHLLDQLVEKRLENHFKTKGFEGNFSQVKNKVADDLFKPLVDKIAEKAAAYGMTLTSENRGEKLASYRFIEFVAQEKEKKEISSREWALEQQTKTISRAHQEELSFDDALKIERGHYSDVTFSPLYGPLFFLSGGRRIDKTLPLDKLLEMQEVLAGDAKHRFYQELLEKIPSLSDTSTNA